MNEAFVINTLTKEQLCRDDPRSAELLHPFLEGKDLKRWRAEPRGLWIIYIPKNRVTIDDYPAIRDWLLQFKDQLEKRATVQEWYELQQAQEAYSGPFGKPKLSYPHFSQGSKFSYEPKGFYSNDKTYFVPTDDLSLLALLNAKTTWFYLSSVAPAMRGGVWRLELRVQYVETVPIPPATDAQKADLATLAEAAQAAAEKRYALQQEVLRRIPDLAYNPDTQLTTRLKEWWNLPSFVAFHAEVKRS